MKQVWTLSRKETQAYFNSPVAYVVLGVFLGLIGYLYMSVFFLSQMASMRNFFGLAPVLLVVFGPAITMRMFAEEKKSGTLEPLLVLPVTEAQVVLGKFLASVGIFATGMLFTLPYVLSVAYLAIPGAGIDFGPIVGGYLGLLLLAAVFLSFGLMASAMTKNQIISFIVALVFCFFFYFVDKFSVFLPLKWGYFLTYISVDTHFSNIARGVIDSRDLVYYASLLTFVLWTTIQILKRNKQA